jgi:TadE-like protein
MPSSFCQRGQSATEFLVIFPALVLLVFGILQFALLYQTRAVLNHATLLAARAGAMHNGSTSEMRSALARGLAPLFATEATKADYNNAVLRAKKEASAGYSAIDILNPTADALSDFGRDKLDGSGGKELPNDTLNYRKTDAGPSSKISIQDANILHIRVTYCSRLIVPIIDRILYATLHSPDPMAAVGTQATGMNNPMATTVDPSSTDCGTVANDGRRIKVQSEAFVRMQSSFFDGHMVASSGGKPAGGLAAAGVGGIPPGGGSGGDGNSSGSGSGGGGGSGAGGLGRGGPDGNSGGGGNPFCAPSDPACSVCEPGKKKVDGQCVPDVCVVPNPPPTTPWTPTTPCGLPVCFTPIPTTPKP